MHGWTLGKVRSFARLSSLGQASDSDSNSDSDSDLDLGDDKNLLTSPS